MTTVLVFETGGCCSGGGCGGGADNKFVRFAADLHWLKEQGVSVTRYNFSQEPLVFADDEDVMSALEDKDLDALPLVKINGVVKTSGAYPTREELAAWVGVPYVAALPGEVAAFVKAKGSCASGDSCSDECSCG